MICRGFLERVFLERFAATSELSQCKYLHHRENPLQQVNARLLDESKKILKRLIDLKNMFKSVILQRRCCLCHYCCCCSCYLGLRLIQCFLGFCSVAFKEEIYLKEIDLFERIK